MENSQSSNPGSIPGSATITLCFHLLRPIISKQLRDPLKLLEIVVALENTLKLQVGVTFWNTVSRRHLLGVSWNRGDARTLSRAGNFFNGREGDFPSTERLEPGTTPGLFKTTEL